MKRTYSENIRKETMSIGFILLVGLLFCVSLGLGKQVPLDLFADTYHGTALSNSYLESFSFISDSFRNRESLLWNPDDATGGAPFLADWGNRAYSPFSLPFYVLDLYPAILLSVLLKLWVAGLAAYYTARKLGYAPILSLLCAQTFQASHYLFAQPLEPFSDALPWIPLLFLYAERLYLKQARYWPVGAVIIALMLLSGDWMATFCSVLVMVGYIAIHQFAHPHEKGLHLPMLAMAASVVAALGLVAIQLVPYLDFVANSVHVSSVPKFLPGMRDLAGVIFPDIGQLGHFGVIHCGIIQALTTVLWIIMRPSLFEHQRSKIDGLQITGLCLIGCTLLYGQFASMTAFSVTLSHHQLLMPWGFMMALSTVITISIWLELSPEQCKSVIRRGQIIFPIFLISTYYVAITTEVGSGSSASKVAMITIVSIIVAAYFALLSYTLFRPKAIGLAVSLIVLNCIDLTAASYFNGYRSPMPDPPYPTLERSATINPQKRVESRVADFAHALQQHPELANLSPERFINIDLHRVDQMNRTLRRSLLLRTVTGSGQAVFEKREHAAELQLIQDYRVAEDWNPDELSAHLPPLVEQSIDKSAWLGPSPEPEFIGTPTHTSIGVRVNPESDLVLVINRVINQDWVASVDGEFRPHFPVNGIYAGIQVSPGDQVILFEYDPWSLGMGRIISGIVVIIIGLGYLNLAYHRIHASYMRI